VTGPTVDRIELRRISLPLVRPFQTSFGTWTERDILLVRVRADGVDGWGECVAGTTPTYSSEYTAEAHRVVADVLGPLLLGAPAVGVDVAGALAPVKGHRMAKTALETAVLDVELRAAGRSLADALGGRRPSVPVGVSIGIPDTLDDLRRIVDEHRAEGYGRIKLKIKPGFDVEPVGVVRDHVGPDLMLQVDGNAAYRADDAGQARDLAALDPFALALIEQPYPEEEMLAHVDLADRMHTPICLDESILNRATTADALRLGACSIVNIKAGRVGGYLEAAAIHDLCVEAGVPVWCGGMLETGIGRAANLALASLPGFTLPGDISATARYWHRDIVTEPFTVDGRGHMAVPAGPGLGVEIDHDFLDSVTEAVEEVRAG
jgi:O-succinylbenzoate synthase